MTIEEYNKSAEVMAFLAIILCFLGAFVVLVDFVTFLLKMMYYGVWVVYLGIKVIL